MYRNNLANTVEELKNRVGDAMASLTIKEIHLKEFRFRVKFLEGMGDGSTA